jgi:Uma2 family endonuclease
MMPPMPRIPPLDRPATYEDLLKVPDICVAEIVDGELHASPRPAPPHANAASVLGGDLVPPFQGGRGGPGGWWVLDEPELHLGPDTLVPDLAAWRRTRMRVLPSTAYFTLAPDWVCEVVSPSTASLDRVKKLRIYAREGVGHAWLVDPLARTLEVLRLASKRWTILATHGGTDVVRAEPFAEIEIALASLWVTPPLGRRKSGAGSTPDIGPSSRQDIPPPGIPRGRSS